MNGVRKGAAEKVSASWASGESMSYTHKEVTQDPGGEANSENGGRTSVTSSQKETQPGQEGNDKRLTKEMQTQLASCLHLLGWQPWKDTENKSWQGRRQKRTLVCSWLNANSYSHYGNFYGGSSKQNKKLKLVTTMWPPPFLSLSTYLKEIRPIYQRPLHFHACRGISLSSEKWDPFKCPTTDDWVKKMCYL